MDHSRSSVKPQPRLHGFGHVTGFGQYSEHMSQPAMLFMKTLLSPYPHAKVRSIDTMEATLVVPRDQTSTIAAQLFKELPIADVTIEDPEVEEIIGRIFTEKILS